MTTRGALIYGTARVSKGTCGCGTPQYIIRVAAFGGRSGCLKTRVRANGFGRHRIAQCEDGRNRIVKGYGGPRAGLLNVEHADIDATSENH